MVIRENNLSETLSLDGEWQIIAGDYSGVVRVPGVWDLQGVDAQTVIYRRAVFVPESWSGAAIMLQFDAVSYHIEAFVNSVPVGMHDGLWAAFDFDISGAVQFGAENTIELHVTKPNPHDKPPYSYREVLVGFIPYVSTTFGGIWQSARLVAHRAGMFTNIQVQPDIGKRCVSLGIERKTSHADSEIEVTVLDPTDHYIVTLQRYDNSQEIPIPDVKVWSPDAPNLYTVIVREKIGDTVIGEVRRQFGFRRLHNDGSRLLFNGAPITLRGVLSWGWDPATLAPTPTDEQIRDEFRRVRELGFNLYKLCLYVPPKRVFEIADEEGMLLWLEMPMWWQRTTEQFHQQTRDEYRDVFRQVHHHPSIVIYSLGCELDSDMANVHLLASLNYLAREHTRDALICDNSGSGEAYGGLAFDFADFNDYHFYADMHFFTPLLDHFRRDWRTQRPLIFGEFCDCDDYRDVSALAETRPAWRDYLGVEGNLTRWAYSEQEKRMANHDLPFTDAQLEKISHGQSFAVRKMILEQVRTRGEIGGYVITGLRDTPISTSGMFDDRGHAKYDAQRFRMINSDAVLLLETGRARVWKNGGDRIAPMDKFNYFSGSPIRLEVILSDTGSIGKPRSFSELTWQLTDAAKGIRQQGRVSISNPPSGSPQRIFTIVFDAPVVQTAAMFELSVQLGTQQSAVRNCWNLWVYPRFPMPNVYDPIQHYPELQRSESGSVMITTIYDKTVEDAVHGGAKAILINDRGGGLPVVAVPFWRESIKLLTDHPILAGLPHPGYVGEQFYHLATDYAFDVSAFESTPILRRLDARLFALSDYMVELRIGKGRMIASTLHFGGGAGDQVNGLESNVLGQYLLHRMVEYLRGV